MKGARGHFAPGSYGACSKLSSIKEDPGVPAVTDMIANLVKGNEAVARTAREIFHIASGANDQPTCDLLTQRMQIAEKTAWMLSSLSDQSAA